MSAQPPPEGTTRRPPIGKIAPDDPRADDVQQLLARHLAFAHEHTPPEDVHALDISALVDSAISFYAFRRDGVVIAVGALKQLDARHAEIKSMHTAAEARCQGVGAAMLAHLLALARSRGVRRVSLETGSMQAFAPARAMYARAGFAECGPFGDYAASPYSTFMTLPLEDEQAPE